MPSEVKITGVNFMDNTSDTESLRSRIREVEDENQELRTQNLLQNRTIIEMRNEMILMRIQLSEMADTSSLLMERVRNLSHNVSHNQMHSGTNGNVGLITAPPLMAPPPVPPPLPSTRIRIAPRQVGAGEAVTTPLGVSLSSPPRHRIKRDSRQGFYRSTRNPYRRLDVQEPGPSTPSQFITSERPNYFVGLRIIPQFQTSFVCSQNQSSGYSDSASDSSGSDENPQLFKKLKTKSVEEESHLKNSTNFAKNFEFIKKVRNLHHQRVRYSAAILQNYNLSVSNTNSKFVFPLPWERKPRDNQPSTSGNEIRFPRQLDANVNPNLSPGNVNELRSATKISNCTQYTFPTIHEGLHHNALQSTVTQTGQIARLRKLKKHIPYISSNDTKIFEASKKTVEKQENDAAAAAAVSKDKMGKGFSGRSADSESVSSADESRRRSRNVLSGEVSSDFEADESSNCMTSNENSLERISISKSNLENPQGKSNQ